MAADDNDNALSALSKILLLTTVLTTFGSSLLYGYNMAVYNLPRDNIVCFFNETILKLDCTNRGTPTNNTVSTTSIYDGVSLYSYLSAIFVVSGMIGAFSTGWVADFFGRRNGLLFNHSFVILGGIISGFTVAFKVPALAFIGRFFIGLNCGITIGLASMYLTEIAPRKVRGAIGACHQLAVTIGIVVGYLMTMTFTMNTETLWPIACALTAVPALISLFTLPFCPESPRFLYLKKNKPDAAREAFLRVNTVEDVDLFLAELRDEVEFAKSQPAFRFTQLFVQRDLRMPLLIACLIQVLQQLSGINAVIAYSSDMLTTAGIHVTYNQWCVVAIGVFNVLCTLVSLPLIERAGRRTLILWPTVVLAASLLCLTVTVNLATMKSNDTDPNTKSSFQVAMGGLSVFFILVYIAGFAVGLGPIPGLIVAEIFRSGPRGAAYSISQALQWFSNLIVLSTYPKLNALIGGYSFLPFFFIVCACWVFFFLFMPETRNRTFDEVARDLAFGNVVINKREATFLPDNELDAGITKPDDIEASAPLMKESVA